MVRRPWGRWQSAASAIHHYYCFYCVEFHFIRASFFHEFLGHVLHLTVSARHKVHIVCDRSAPYRDRNVVVVEGFLYNYFQQHDEMRWAE